MEWNCHTHTQNPGNKCASIFFNDDDDDDDDDDEPVGEPC